MYSIRQMCDVLEVSRAGFYEWLNAAPSQRAEENSRLVTQLKVLFYSHKGRYGAPRLHKVLQREGIRCSKGRVARLMREAGLRSKYKKPKRPKFWKEQPSMTYAENLPERNFEAGSSGQRWVTDIKYIATYEGWAFLCVVLDLCDRKVLGWSVRGDMQEELVLEALEMAVNRGKLEAGTLLHSDRCGQYTSIRYQEALQSYGITCSMSRKGNCWDNAAMESFFGTVEQELLVDTRFRNVSDARSGLFAFIEIYYNRQRLHSALGYRTPHEGK